MHKKSFLSLSLCKPFNCLLLQNIGSMRTAQLWLFLMLGFGIQVCSAGVLLNSFLKGNLLKSKLFLKLCTHIQCLGSNHWFSFYFIIETKLIAIDKRYRADLYIWWFHLESWRGFSQLYLWATTLGCFLQPNISPQPMFFFPGCFGWGFFAITGNCIYFIQYSLLSQRQGKPCSSIRKQVMFAVFDLLPLKRVSPLPPYCSYLKNCYKNTLYE